MFDDDDDPGHAAPTGRWLLYRSDLRRCRDVFLGACATEPEARREVHRLNRALVEACGAITARDGKPIPLVYCCREDQGKRPEQKGEAHWCSRLTREQVREIRRLLAAGVQQKEIARQHGITQGTVSAIALRRSWAWLEEEEEPACVSS